MSDQQEVDYGGNGADGAKDPAATNGEDDAGVRLAAVEAERDDVKDRMLRIAADFENWKKRARKEQEDAETKVREGVLKDVLDVMDNLERAVDAYGGGAPAGGAGKTAATNLGGASVDGAAVLKGVGLVLRLLQSKLDRYGVKAIEAHGQPFDPRLHEAISRAETTAVPAGHVAAELQRGYRIGDRLLRPSMVSVATAPAGASDGARGADNSSGQGGGGGGDHAS